MKLLRKRSSLDIFRQYAKSEFSMRHFYLEKLFCLLFPFLIKYKRPTMKKPIPMHKLDARIWKIPSSNVIRPDIQNNTPIMILMTLLLISTSTNNILC